jgi:hypothetical protein
MRICSSADPGMSPVANAAVRSSAGLGEGGLAQLPGRVPRRQRAVDQGVEVPLGQERLPAVAADQLPVPAAADHDVIHQRIDVPVGARRRQVPVGVTDLTDPPVELDVREGEGFEEVHEPILSQGPSGHGYYPSRPRPASRAATMA